MTASQARGTAHLVSGLPGADSASPRACQFARRAPSCVSFSLDVSHYCWTTSRASSEAAVPSRFFSFPTRSLPLSFLLACLLPFSAFPPSAGRTVTLGDLLPRPSRNLERLYILFLEILRHLLSDSQPQFDSINLLVISPLHPKSTFVALVLLAVLCRFNILALKMKL